MHLGEAGHCTLYQEKCPVCSAVFSVQCAVSSVHDLPICTKQLQTVLGVGTESLCRPGCSVVVRVCLYSAHCDVSVMCIHEVHMYRLVVFASTSVTSPLSLQ